MSSTHKYQDQGLLQRIAAGDEEAMNIIFRTYYPKLCFFAESITGNREEARDIAQEALLLFWKQRKQFASRKDQQLAAFLFTVVKRDCYDFQKHQRVKKSKQSEILAASPVLEEDTQNAMIYVEVLQKIHREIKELPFPQSRIVSLSFIDGLSTQEIAEEMDLTANNVRVLKSRAVEKLRHTLLRQNIMPLLFFLLLFFMFFVLICNDSLFRSLY